MASLFFYSSLTLSLSLALVDSMMELSIDRAIIVCLIVSPLGIGECSELIYNAKHNESSHVSVNKYLHLISYIFIIRL